MSAADTVHTTTELARGAAVGRYVVIEQLGRGGMGVVYAAYDPELDRRVALKMMRVVGADRELVADARDRLLREAQALAQLAHPNVVSVFDVGTYGEHVFVTLELVEGITLRAWVREQSPPPRDIVRAFIQAGRGLAAAHAAGLVHRDFKPSNAIIGDDGRVRVLDFGLARSATPGALREPRLAQTGSSDEATTRRLDDPLTEAGAVVGTPRYMSPEQITGGEITPLSDQFSFCVALYLSVYGEHPFPANDTRELAERIHAGHIAPPPRDTRVPARVRRVLERGLAPAPEHRYPSMDALVDDLAREPGRMWRRVALAVALFAAIGGAVYSVAQPSAAEQRCARAGDEVDRVWHPQAATAIEQAFEAAPRPYAADTARRVSEALDARARAWRAMRRQACEATHVRGVQSDTLLDARMRCLDRRLDETAALIGVLGDRVDGEAIDRAVQAVDELLPLSSCADVDALRTAIPPPTGAAERERLRALERQLDRARALDSAGQFDAGLAISAPAVEAARALDYAPVVAEALLVHGQLLLATSDLTAAEQALLGAAEAAAVARRDDLAASAWALLVGVIGHHAGRYDDGLLLGHAARAAVARAGAPATADARLLNNLGLIHFGRGDPERAQALYERALAAQTEAFGADAHELAPTLTNLGNALVARGDYAAAERALERALALDRAHLGERHPDVATTLTDLGTVWAARGDYERARDLHARALEIWEDALGPSHPHVAAALVNLGDADNNLGDHDRATARFERAQTILTESLGAAHPHVAYAVVNLAEVDRVRGRCDAAVPRYREALEIWEPSVGGDHPYVAFALTGLGQCQLALGHRQDAQITLTRAVAIYERAGSDDDRAAAARDALTRANSSGRP